MHQENPGINLSHLNLFECGFMSMGKLLIVEKNFKKYCNLHFFKEWEV